MLLIESKITSPVDTDQIRRHMAGAYRRGLNPAGIVVIGVSDHQNLPDGAVFRPWRDVFVWLRHWQSRSPWAARTADFMEIAETRLIEKEKLREGTLTQFHGFTFDATQPFGYIPAKRLLKLAMEELRGRTELVRELDIDPEAQGRPAITNDGAYVWNFLRLKWGAAEKFTNYPHLTLVVGSERVEATVTIPDATKASIRRNLIRLGEEGFVRLTHEVNGRLRPVLAEAEGAAPRFFASQQHFITTKSAITDSLLKFDLRTAGGPSGMTDRRIKSQPEWLQTAFRVFAGKRSNYEMRVGAIFPYRNCEKIRSRGAIDLIAKAWIACKPLIETLRAESPGRLAGCDSRDTRLSLSGVQSPNRSTDICPS